MTQAPVSVSVRNKSALVRLNGGRIKSLCRFLLLKVILALSLKNL